MEHKQDLHPIFIPMCGQHGTTQPNSRWTQRLKAASEGLGGRRRAGESRHQQQQSSEASVPLFWLPDTALHPAVTLADPCPVPMLPTAAFPAIP